MDDVFSDPPEPEAMSADEKRLQNDIATVMSTEQGRRFVSRMIHEGGIMAGGVLTEHQCGKRDLALHIRSVIKAYDPDHFRLMERENDYA